MKFDFKDNKSVSYRGSHSWRDLNEQRSKRIVTIASVLRRIRGYLRYLMLMVDMNLQLNKGQDKKGGKKGWHMVGSHIF